MYFPFMKNYFDSLKLTFPFFNSLFSILSDSLQSLKTTVANYQKIKQKKQSVGRHCLMCLDNNNNNIKIKINCFLKLTRLGLLKHIHTDYVYLQLNLKDRNFALNVLVNILFRKIA